MPSIGTAMSCRGQIEPILSSPRTELHGAVLGIAGVRDNERALRELVHFGTRFSDDLERDYENFNCQYREHYGRWCPIASADGAPAPPSNLQAEVNALGRARLTWQDNDPRADGYEVEYRWTAPYTEERRHRFGPYDPLRPLIDRRDEATINLPARDAGTIYEFRVRAWKGDALSLPSSKVWARIPGGLRIQAPSDVSVEVDRWLSPVVRWTDNSDNESGFEVQLLQDGEPIARQWAVADEARISGMHALPRIGAEYGVRVFAYNSSGYSESSEVATFRWTHPHAPEAPGGVAASAVGPTTVRVTWAPSRAADGAYRASAELPGRAP